MQTDSVPLFGTTKLSAVCNKAYTADLDCVRTEQPHGASEFDRGVVDESYAHCRCGFDIQLGELSCKTQRSLQEKLIFGAFVDISRRDWALRTSFFKGYPRR